MSSLTTAQTRNAVEALIPFYERLRPEDVSRFGEFYATEASFRDPFNHVGNLQGIQRIFAHMFTQVHDPAFKVTRYLVGEGDAVLFWTFSFRFKGLGCKKSEVSLEGVSHLAFNEMGQVTLHRDYWDAAEELYSRIPVIGVMMRGLQRMIRA